MSDGPVRSGSTGAGVFTLHCRGDVRLYRGGADCTPKSKKGRALLAVLAAEQRPLTRVKIIDLLWSDRQEEQARASLRTLLADLKEQFNSGFDELLIVDRERVALGPTVRTDLTELALARPAGELFEGLDHIDPELDEWLRTEREKWGTVTTEAAPVTAAAHRANPRGSPPWALALALVLALVAGALVYFRPSAEAEQPVVAVLKFKDLTGKNALLADGFAEELRIQLAQNPKVLIVGRSSSEDASVAVGNTQAAGSRLNASHVIEGSLRSIGQELQVNLRLVDARTGRLLWTGAARAGGASIATDTSALAAQIGELLTDVLSSGTPARYFRADDRAYAAVFDTRAAMNGGSPDKISQHIGELEEIVRSNPDFVPALATLGRAIMSASDHPFTRGPIPLARAREQAAFYARRAIRLAPSYAPAYDALAAAYRDMDEALPLVRKALSLSPGLAVAHRRLAFQLEQIGDYDGALDHWRTAARLDPLNLTASLQLLRALDMKGDKGELRRVGADFAGRVTDPKTRWTWDAMRAVYEGGDLSRYVLSGLRSERLDPEDLYTQRFLMLGLELLFGPGAARPYAGAADSFSALVFDRDLAGVRRKIAADPAGFFRLDFETSNAAEFLARIGRLDVLIDAYDRSKRAKYPPRPTEYYGVGDLLVIGLRERGRAADAEQVLRIMKREMSRERGLREEYSRATEAAVQLLRGRREQAAKDLAWAYRDEWSLGVLNVGRPAFEFYVFMPIRDDPRIIAVRNRYEREIVRERAEAIHEMQAAHIRPLRCRSIPQICA